MNLAPGGKEVSESQPLISTSLRVEFFVAAGRILYERATCQNVANTVYIHGLRFGADLNNNNE